jgi:hypothetical protein
MERLTYKSSMGDYGSNIVYDNEDYTERLWQEIQTLRNALGKYEDLDLTPDEIKRLLYGEKK